MFVPRAWRVLHAPHAVARRRASVGRPCLPVAVGAPACQVRACPSGLAARLAAAEARRGGRLAEPTWRLGELQRAPRGTAEPLRAGAAQWRSGCAWRQMAVGSRKRGDSMPECWKPSPHMRPGSVLREIILLVKMQRENRQRPTHMKRRRTRRARRACVTAVTRTSASPCRRPRRHSTGRVQATKACSAASRACAPRGRRHARSGVR